MCIWSRRPSDYIVITVLNIFHRARELSSIAGPRREEGALPFTFNVSLTGRVELILPLSIVCDRKQHDIFSLLGHS